MDGKRWALLLAVAAMAGLAGGALSHRIPGAREAEARAEKPSHVRVVRAEKVELVDAAGEARAWMEIDADGNPGLFLARGGCIMASFSLVGEGRPRLDLGDNCTVRAVVKLNEEGDPVISLFDRGKKVVWSAP